MITSLFERPELPNFCHMTASTISSESRDTVLLVTSWTETVAPQPLFQNIFILSLLRVANFTLISSKLQPCLLKQPL